MRILYLITGLRLGGAERQLLLIAEQMQFTGHKVLVIALESNGSMVKCFKEKGIAVDGLGVRGIKSLPSAYHKLNAMVKEFRPDLIHSHMIHANIMAGLFKLFNRQYKLVSTAHNIREGNALMLGYYFVSRVADCSTNVSKEAFDHFIKRRYFRADRAAFIPNAIDTTDFDPAKYDKNGIRVQLGIPQQKYVFFSAGRLHHQKNYELLLRAFALLSNQLPDNLLVIAGQGPEQKFLEKLARDLRIEQNTCFLGKRDDIPALMCMADCFVLSSRFEGFGLVVGEAMAMQVPVIATDCGGVKEVMDGYGTLVQAGNMYELAVAMLAQARQKEKMEQKDCRRHIEVNYSVSSIRDRWLNLYARL